MWRVLILPDNYFWEIESVIPLTSTSRKQRIVKMTTQNSILDPTSLDHHVDQ